MVTIVQPSHIKGTVQAPASKSSMQRAVAAALLHMGETVIHRPGYSNDDKAALGVIRDLGAVVETLENGSLRIKSKGMGAQAEVADARTGTKLEVEDAGDGRVKAMTGEDRLQVNCGESGLGIRMFAPIIALSNRSVTVTGEGSLLGRPLDFFDIVFPQLGIRVLSNKGRLPLEIQGPLQPRTIEIDGSLSSQFLTGLLMAFAAAGARAVVIKVNNLKSKPYVDLTLEVMRHFGWEVWNRNYEQFLFDGSGDRPGTIEYTVEGDWSGGAFLLVAGALAGPIVVRGLDTRSTQADKAILEALRDSGATVTAEGGMIRIGPVEAKGGVLRSFSFNATDCPDLFPPLTALAACCEGTTVIEGVSRLAHKESNRALTLQEEFGKMGVDIKLAGDKMLIRGGEGIRGAIVHSRHDHRIAMACAVAALRADGPVTIEEAQAIGKSYPDFYQHLQQLGASVDTREAISDNSNY